MIPAVESALLLIDIDAMEDSKYQRLLQNQYK
ncbi:MAG: type III toxin-antitoxin system ToxN/AbiQ family toxin [Lachnospiraceae bacterium]